MFLLTSSLELCRLNRSFTQNCIYPIFEKLKFHICFLDATFFKIAPSVALLFSSSSLFSFQGASQGYSLEVPSKLNNTRGKRSDLEVCSLLSLHCLLRKEVIQPLVLERLPCYDFTPITKPTFGRVLHKVRLRTSGVPGSHGVTGGVYKARERIHRGMLIRDY